MINARVLLLRLVQDGMIQADRRDMLGDRDTIRILENLGYAQVVEKGGRAVLRATFAGHCEVRKFL